MKYFKWIIQFIIGNNSTKKAPKKTKTIETQISGCIGDSKPNDPTQSCSSSPLQESRAEESLGGGAQGEGSQVKTTQVEKAQVAESPLGESQVAESQELSHLAPSSAPESRSLRLMTPSCSSTGILPAASPRLPNHLTEEEQARRLLAIVVARQATQFISHVTTARVELSPIQLKDGIKGKIVGKDGRNARYFEEKAGVDLILNDDAGAVLISSFDPFRREVARVALESLVRDGRIQHARIEESLAEAKAQVDQNARDWGSKAAKDLDIQNLHPAIVRVLGTLKFRHSFGQNQLEHSIESAFLCGNLASEMGFDFKLARRAALLHDLGKALDQTRDGGHAQAGAEFAKRYGECAEVVQAIAAHHEEVAPHSWLDHLVIAADALSGARPGARHGSTQTAVERAAEMEKIALETAGVSEAFAVQAGREIRVFVDGMQIGDVAMAGVAREIANRIGTEVRFPGQIKVTVLRELRVTEVASR